jgi:poly(3-hydroxybutyrate) depolymerase
MTRWRVAVPIWAAASILVTCCLSAGAAENVRVTTNDSRVITGELLSARTAKTLIVRSGVRDVYLSSSIVKSIDRAAAQTVPTYTLKANLKRVNSTPKKGKIFMVVTETRLTAFNENGIGSVSLRDPKLGRVSFAVVVTRITPQTYEFQGVEYDWKLGFPCAFPNWMWKRLIFKEIDFKSVESLTKAVNFFVQAGDRRTVGELLVALEKIDPPAAAEQRAAAEIDAVRKTLRQTERLEFRGMHRKAAALISSAKMSAKARAMDGDLAARLDSESARLKQSVDTLAEAGKILADHEITVKRLSLADARRVVKAFSLGVDGPGKLTKQHVELFLQPWSGPLLEAGKLDAKLLAEADTLAKATATYFAAERPVDTRGLGRQFLRSSLPMAAKLAIFSKATAPPADAAKSGGPITYSHPKTREKFHYYITLPPDYDPNRATPAMICMHGQKSKAGVMKRFWGRTAAANGMILIDPEYIYGRTEGFQFSAQEHRAVLGALWHAAKTVNIDTDRVYLNGHSQGGHACWDIGAAHAGRFAGVLPVIGAPFLNDPLANYTDTALYSIDGSLDAGAPKRNQAAMRKIAAHGADATYVEYIGRGHEAFFEEHDRASEWMRRHRRDPAPKKLHLVAIRDEDRRRRWIEIQGNPKRLLSAKGGKIRIRPEPTNATVQASISDGIITLGTKNVSKMRILLSPRLIDFSRKVTVILNGRLARKQAVRADWAFALADSFTRRDRQDIHLGQISLYVRSRR